MGPACSEPLIRWILVALNIGPPVTRRSEASSSVVATMVVIRRCSAL